MNPTRMERWLPISGYEGYYEVSDQGRVRSLARTVPHGNSGHVTLKGKMLAFVMTTGGYPRVALSRSARIREAKVHILVLEAFVGPRPVGMDACHHNDIPDDNRLENLRWGSRSENKFDEVRNGIHANARKTHCKWGHEFSGINLRINANGSRTCRTCQKKNMREYKNRKAAA